MMCVYDTCGSVTASIIDEWFHRMVYTSMWRPCRGLSLSQHTTALCFATTLCNAGITSDRTMRVVDSKTECAQPAIANHEVELETHRNGMPSACERMVERSCAEGQRNRNCKCMIGPPLRCLGLRQKLHFERG